MPKMQFVLTGLSKSQSFRDCSIGTVVKLSNRYYAVNTGSDWLAIKEESGGITEELFKKINQIARDYCYNKDILVPELSLIVLTIQDGRLLGIADFSENDTVEPVAAKERADPALYLSIYNYGIF